MHAEMLAIEEEIFQALGMPYRVLDICTGDLGGPAYRKFDLEAWMPGRGERGEYGEVTSTSDCTDYQARRLNIRYRPAGQKGTRFVHTLNGTAVASQPGPDRDPGELPAGRRPGRRPRGAPALPRQGRDRSFRTLRGRISSPRTMRSSPVCERSAADRSGLTSVRRSASDESGRVAIDGPRRRQADAKPAPGARPPRADPGRRDRRPARLLRRPAPGAHRRDDRGPRGRARGTRSSASCRRATAPRS